MEFSSSAMQQTLYVKETSTDSFTNGAKAAKSVGAGNSFKHYRRDKTNKAPRKRTFVANMTKQPQQLTETLASAARGVGDGLGTAKPALALATMGANSSVVTSAGATAFGGAQAVSMEAFPVIAPAVVYGTKTFPASQHSVSGPGVFGSSGIIQRAVTSSVISSGVNVAGINGSFQPTFGAAAQAQAQAPAPVMYSLGRPVAPTVTFSDPELSAALARLEAGVIDKPAVPVLGTIRSRAVTTTLDNNAASSFSRAVFTATTKPLASDSMPSQFSNQSGFLCASPATSNASDMQQHMAMAAVSPLPSAGSMSPSHSSDDGSICTLESASSGALASPMYHNAMPISRSGSMSTGSGVVSAAATLQAPAAAPEAEAWDPIDKFIDEFLADDVDAGSMPNANIAGATAAANIFRQWSHELPAAAAPADAAPSRKRGAEEMLAPQGAQQQQQQRNSLAAEVDALLSDLFSADEALPPQPKRSKGPGFGAEGEDVLLPGSWLDGLLSDDLYMDGAF